MADTGPWGASSIHPEPLRGNLSCDVAIIGSGITGTMAAYLLSQEGLSVAMFDDTWGGIATPRTTAFLVEAIDTSAKDLISLEGREKAARILRSHREAIETYERICTDENIECHFMRCPLYLYSNEGSDPAALEGEKACLIELGVTVSDATIPLPHASCIVLPRQAKFQPMDFVNELQKRAQHKGVQFYSSRVTLKNDHVLTTEKGRIEARHILLATHYPEPQPARLYFKKARYVSFVEEHFIPNGSLPEGLYIDNDNPYHYIRADASGDEMRVLVGGEDRRADIQTPAEKHFEALKDYAHNVLPDITRAGRKWTGPIIEPGDGLAYIGRIREGGPFYATAFSGNGMTYGVLAAQIFHDAVCGLPNPYADLYAADRPVKVLPHMKKAVEYVEEFAGGALENLLYDGDASEDQ